MLPIIIPAREFWNEETEEFSYSKETHLQLEHSLISISNWEMKWHLPYFDGVKTEEQAIDYIKCMTLTKNVPDSVYNYLSIDNVRAINAYMQDSMTATTINDVQSKTAPRSQKVTSELIYYWMIQFGIPFTCDKWHINRLIMLIRVCAEENKPKKKRSAKAIAEDYRMLNAARKAQYGTKG